MSLSQNSAERQRRGGATARPPDPPFSRIRSPHPSAARLTAAAQACIEAVVTGCSTEITDPSARPARIFISAAEPSGDRHAAELIRKIRDISPDTRFSGVAGPLMQAAGCDAMADWTRQATMLVGAVRLTRQAYRLWADVRRRLTAEPVDLAILVDSPALHLPMAKRIRPTGCPILYYIAPQLWAWAPWRIRRLRKRVDRLAAILPFEEEYFRQRGVDATFVGHPLVQQLHAPSPDPHKVDSLKQLGSPMIACLPGSRDHVIREVLPGQIEVARAIAARHNNAAFLFAAAHEEAATHLQQALNGETFQYRIEVDRNAEVLAAADLALVTSGTATLEVACHRLPMVILYNGSKWGYRLIGRWLIQTPHLSLPNILAGRQIVPEFMPYYASTEPIAAEALDILADEHRRQKMRDDLDAVIQSLGTQSAAERTAKIALDMIR